MASLPEGIDSNFFFVSPIAVIFHKVSCFRLKYFFSFFSQKTVKRTGFGDTDLLTDSAICDIIYW